MPVAVDLIHAIWTRFSTMARLGLDAWKPSQVPGFTPTANLQHKHRWKPFSCAKTCMLPTLWKASHGYTNRALGFSAARPGHQAHAAQRTCGSTHSKCTPALSDRLVGRLVVCRMAERPRQEWPRLSGLGHLIAALPVRWHDVRAPVDRVALDSQRGLALPFDAPMRRMRAVCHIHCGSTAVDVHPQWQPARRWTGHRSLEAAKPRASTTKHPSGVHLFPLSSSDADTRAWRCAIRNMVPCA